MAGGLHSLRSIIILPFAVIIVALGAVAGYVGYRLGMDSVSELSQQLGSQIADSVSREFNILLATPHSLLEANAAMIGNGELDGADQIALQRYFWRQAGANKFVTSIYYGNSQGGLAVGGREASGRPTYVIGTRDFRAGTFEKYAVDEAGRPGKMLAAFPDYDARTRPWYRAAVNQGGPAWSEVYLLFTRNDLAISPSRPVFDPEGRLLGVVGADLFLSHLSKIMKGIVGRSPWTVFVLDQEGLLVGSSTDERPFVSAKGGASYQRIKGTQSEIGVIRESARFVQGHDREHRNVVSNPHVISVHGVAHYLLERSFHDEYGIDWTVCVVMPQESVLGRVPQGRWIVAGVVLGAIFLCVGIGFLVARRVTGPIFRLRDAANDLAGGKWKTSLPVAKTKEVGQLATAFASMRDQLKNSMEEDARHVKELSEAEERLRLAADGANIAFWDFNPQTGKAYFSHRWMSMLGYAPQEMEHSYDTWRSLIHPDDVERAEQIVFDHIESGAPMSFEFRLRTKDGGWEHIHSAGMVIERNEDGRAVRMSGIHQNVTEIKSLEAQLRHSQKMDAIGTLSGGIAHDFNNILAAVIGFTELSIFDTAPGSTLRENLEEILKAAERARGLVSQILAFGRKANEPLVLIAVQPIVWECVKLLRATLPSSIEIESHIAPHPLTVLANPSQLHQVLMNLGTNAYQAMGEGTGTMALRVDEVALGEREGARVGLRADQYVMLQVSDTGLGIPDDIKKKIFDPFFTTKPQGQGTGLGLSVVHGIVKGMSGGIHVESTPGQGACFTVYLPSICEKTPQETAVREEQEQAVISRRVLFVDDEPSLARLGKKALEKVGCVVEAFTDPREALRAFEADPASFDLIVTDQTMPGLTGAKLVQRAKELRPGVQAIICTGHSDVLNDQKARDAGAACLLRKPVRRETLVNAIKDLV